VALLLVELRSNGPFWDRYEKFLEARLNWPRPVVRRLDEVTDEILSRLEDPRRSGTWDRRGLVVGRVQSGKTSTYIGLINKAADAGYKLIRRSRRTSQQSAQPDSGPAGRRLPWV